MHGAVARLSIFSLLKWYYGAIWESKTGPARAYGKILLIFWQHLTLFNYLNKFEAFALNIIQMAIFESRASVHLWYPHLDGAAGRLSCVSILSRYFGRPSSLHLPASQC